MQLLLSCFFFFIVYIRIYIFRKLEQYWRASFERISLSAICLWLFQKFSRIYIFYFYLGFIIFNGLTNSHTHQTHHCDTISHTLKTFYLTDLVERGRADHILVTLFRTVLK